MPLGKATGRQQRGETDGTETTDEGNHKNGRAGDVAVICETTK